MLKTKFTLGMSLTVTNSFGGKMQDKYRTLQLTGDIGSLGNVVLYHFLLTSISGLVTIVPNAYSYNRISAGALQSEICYNRTTLEP